MTAERSPEGCYSPGGGVDITRRLVRSQTEARLRREAGLPPAGDTLAAVEAAVEGRCAGPGCSMLLTENSASAHFCGPTCQEVWQQRQPGRPSPGSAPVRGSEEVDPSAMRWRPDLVTAFDDTDLTLLDRHHRDDTGLDYCVYNRADSDRVFLRVDDGHRFVGLEVPWAELEASGPSEPFRRLERELTDQRRLDPSPPEDPQLNLPVFYIGERVYYRRDRDALVEWLRVNGLDSDFVRLGQSATVSDGALTVELFSTGPDGRVLCDELLGGPRIRMATVPLVASPPEPTPAERPLYEGTLVWMPHPPADPEAPTPAELAGGIELGHVLPQGHRPTAVQVDETHWTAASDAVRRVGRQIVATGAAAINLYQGLPPAVQQAMQAAAQAESDLVALRAVCNNDAMYERALAAAGERGWSVRQMADAVAAGRYTDEGWAEPDQITRATGAAWEELLAACRELEGHNPAVRFNAGAAVIEALRGQAPRNRAPGLPADGLLGIPVIPDGSLAPDSWQLEHADGQRFESHVCQWEATARRGALGVEYRCCLRWSDGSACESVTAFPAADLRRTERLVGPRATGGRS